MDIREPRCAVTLRWCLKCASIDPMNEMIAEAERDAPTSPDGADQLQVAYLAILDRAIARDVSFLPSVAEVRRDIEDVRPCGTRVTMRASGAAWGRPTVVRVSTGLRRHQ
jgi:hypothetical protein